MLGVIVTPVVALLCCLRYVSPKDWKGIAISPRRVVVAAVGYRELLRLEPEPEQQRLRNYEIVVGASVPGETHMIYVPRLDIDDRRADTTHPGASIRFRPGIEAHVFVDNRTLRIRRSYLAK